MLPQEKTQYSVTVCAHSVHPHPSTMFYNYTILCNKYYITHPGTYWIPCAAQTLDHTDIYGCQACWCSYDHSLHCYQHTHQYLQFKEGGGTAHMQSSHMQHPNAVGGDVHWRTVRAAWSEASVSAQNQKDALLILSWL